MSNEEAKKLLIVGVAVFLTTTIVMPSAAAQNTAPKSRPKLLEEIVVTAQKREQGIQDVSVSVTAFSEDLLRSLGVGRPRDIAAFTPGLSMNASAIVESDPIFTLRGIGMNDVQTNQNPSVTPYVDNVALASHVMVGFQIFDVERVEVLKGPQGTLYGRNTTGGAIKFISNKPTQKFDFHASVNVGDLGRREFEVAVGGRLADTLSARFATKLTIRNGWQTLRLGPDSGAGVDESNGDVDRRSYRGSLFWEPSGNFNALLVADYAEDRSEVLAFEHAGNLLADDSGGMCSFGLIGVRDEVKCASFAIQRDSVGGNPVTLGRQVVQDQDGPRTVGASFSQGNEIDMNSWGISPTLNWEFGRLTLTSVTSYRKFDRELGTDQGGTPFIISDNLRRMKIESFSQELRLSSNETWDRIKWVFGVYYSEDDNFDSADFNFRDHASFSALFNSTYTQDTKNIAFFGQAEWNITEDFRLIGGARYTDEDRKLSYGGTIAGGGPTPVASFTNEINTTEWTGKLGVDYTPNQDWLIYANVSRGFKGGGFPAAISFMPEELFPYESETLTALEGGFKATLADGRVRLNLALYYYDWKDFQASAATDRANGVRVIVVTNAGDAEVLGLEAELAWQPTDDLSFQLGFNWMDAEIVSGEYDGQTPTHAPKISYNGFFRYDFNSVNTGSFIPFVQVDFSYTDDIQFILPNHPGATEEAYTIANLRFGVRSQNLRWEIAGWIHNLGDKLYRTEVFGPGSGFLPGRIHYGSPRLVGFSLNYTH